MKTKSEVLLYTTIIVGVTVTLASTDAFEAFYNFSRNYEDIELDELVLVIPSLVICLAIHSYIRTRRLNREMTLRRKAERESKKAYRFYKAFMGRMGHDMRTPLNGIIGMLQLVPLADSEEEKQEYLDLALSSAKNLNLLLSDILSVSSLRKGEKPEPRPFDLRKTMHGILDLTRPMAEDKGLSIEMNISDSIPENVNSFEGPLRQILMNVLGNAIRYSPQGTIRINAEHVHEKNSGGYLSLAVEDEGPGIPESEREKIFEPYVQGAIASAGGSGLGLSIVKRIIKLVDGKIRVLDGKNGKGARFEVDIPAPAA